VDPFRASLFSEPEPLPYVDANSSAAEKLALFQALFAGRDDVYALRYENQRTGKKGWTPAVEGGWAEPRGGRRTYLPFTDEVVEDHLAGRIFAGLYPLMPGDTCRLLVCDFDGDGWLLDALAYLDAATAAGIPATLERSQSGRGGHTWMFFSGPVAAASARRLGVGLLRAAMTARAEIDLTSYDRLFPAQDFVAKSSFGNLIALPLQGEAGRRGNTVFLDPATVEPAVDQWAHLSSIPRLSPDDVEASVESMSEVGAGPQLSGATPRTVDAPPAPEVVRGELGAMIAIDRIGLPPWLIAQLKHLAALHNPEFYEKQRLRLSTFRTPRFIRCYDETLDRLLLPRGVLSQVESLLADVKSILNLTDVRPSPKPIEMSFAANLTEQQHAAVEVLRDHDHSVLVAPPGTGKTVIACALIAHRRHPTLVIVDRQALLEQWTSQISELVGLEQSAVGRIGGSATRRSGVVDVAMAQSLARHDDLTGLTESYGFVVVDECHHVPAATFEAAVKRIPARVWLGLTATPYRRDKLEDIILMHCGPIRHTIDTGEAPSAALGRRLIVHETSHTAAHTQELHIQDVLRDLVADEARTALIASHVAEAVDRGRNCLVLSQWRTHLESLQQQLTARGLEPLVLRGGLGKRARADVVAKLNDPANRPFVLLATGSYIGEGFDCPALDALFLAFPLAFKGRIVQYVGRLLRVEDGKHSVEVHDYVDVAVPVLARMHDKRRPAFESLGFDIGPRPRRRRQQTRRLASEPLEF
jgi:superfamily II DNA or RNA helicase